MTPLARLLAGRIAAAGPIPVADFMAECLMHPEHGYYATRDPFGRGGDFITAPEISQMFGELVGLAFAQAWLDQGCPRPFALVELGPGRGTLMADILRATRRLPGFAGAAQIHLVEASPTLRKVQAETLAPTVPQWHDSVATLPDLPSLIVANEFFDALPIRQFQRAGQLWRERVVGLRDGALAFGLADPAPVAALAPRLADTTDGDVVELCPGAVPIAETLAHRIDWGGAVLIVDYGGWHSRGDTLQALRAHQPVPVLAEPGEADLTAHVDFEPLAQVAGRFPGLAASPLVPQGVFLERLGITRRAQTLAEGLRGAALESHIAAHRRLTHPEEMGSLFKCLALVPAGAAPFPGLTHDT